MVQFEYRPYRRAFRQPLQTRYGAWRDRQGIILRLSAGDRVGWGEIAPIEWFGTESWEAVIEFCQHFPSEPCATDVVGIPDRLPTCQFGFAAAWEGLWEGLPAARDWHLSYLLPAGEAGLMAWRSAWQAGYRTFKWKIAVEPIDQELEWFAELGRSLPATTQLRLDANGGLQWQEACRWLEACDALPSSGCQVEFLEQPLPPRDLVALLTLQSHYRTAIALDESVTTIAQLTHCYEAGWRGLFVVKPAIVGFPDALRQFCWQPGVEVVWSSALETAIARQFIQTRLIPSAGGSDRAVGFGIDHWFTEDGLDSPDPEKLWQRLTPI